MLKRIRVSPPSPPFFSFFSPPERIFLFMITTFLPLNSHEANILAPKSHCRKILKDILCDQNKLFSLNLSSWLKNNTSEELSSKIHIGCWCVFSRYSCDSFQKKGEEEMGEGVREKKKIVTNDSRILSIDYQSKLLHAGFKGKKKKKIWTQEFIDGIG